MNKLQLQCASNENLLSTADALMKNIAASRLFISRNSGPGNPTGDAQFDAWFDETFGDLDAQVIDRTQGIERDREKLAGIRSELIGRGLTQAECRKIWQQLQADNKSA